MTALKKEIDHTKKLANNNPPPEKIEEIREIMAEFIFTNKLVDRMVKNEM